MLRTESFIYETDESKMTAEWADRVISYRRMDWQFVISPSEYFANKNWLLSVQSMKDIENYFDDEEFKRNVKFVPLPIMEKPRNILQDEVKKSGIKPYIEANDVSAIQDKDNDVFKLTNRSILENDINAARSKINIQAPYKMDYDKFNGNIDEFDQMGLDASDPSDVRYFIEAHYKLNYVANAQICVDSYSDLNEDEEDIPRYIIDVLCCKATCSWDYVSPVTGQIKSQYLQPSQTRWIRGNRRDGKDAACRGWEKQITLTQLIEQLGDSFNFETQWRDLVSSVNYYNNTQYDGFIRDGVPYNMRLDGMSPEQIKEQGDLPVQLMEWGSLTTMNYKVHFGFIEWEQWCDHAEKRNTKNGLMFPVSSSDFKPTERSLYERKDWYFQKTKCSFYLATGAISQRLYGYGDLFAQLTEGQYDEYSRGSVSIILEEGLPAILVAHPYLHLANYAYYKMVWAIHKSEPDIWDFSYESIIEVAKKMRNELQGQNQPQQAGAFYSATMQLVEYMKKKLYRLHTYPIVDGRVVGGGGSPHQKIPGQLDPLATELRTIVLEWAEYQITDKLGLAPREANTPNPKEGLRLTEIYLKQSRSATGYIPDMIERTFEHKAKIRLLYIQDIINHKASVPYKFLVDLVGKKIIGAVEALGKVAYHRMGCTVKSFSVQQEREDLLQKAEIALANQQITFIEYVMVKNMKDPRKAGIELAYMQEKAAKATQQRAMQLQQQQQAGQQQIIQMQMDLEDRKGMWKLKGDQIIADAQVQGKQLDYQKGVQTTAMKLDAEPQKQAAKAEKDEDILRTQHALENQKPFEDAA